MSSVIVHIGPPKTATTSLQKAVEVIDCPSLYFGGTFQPRPRNSGSLCQRIYHYCLKDPQGDVDAKKLRAEIEETLNKKKSILISEEMFLLDQGANSIERKLQRLANLLHGFECKVLITARSGEGALPSLYQEIFKSLPIQQQIDFGKFCRSRNALCYDYSKIGSILEGLGFGDIVLLEFNKFTSEATDLGSVLNINAPGASVVRLQKENSGKIRTDNQARLIPKVTIKGLGRAPLVRTLIDRLKLRSLPGYREVVSLIDRIHIVPSSDRELVVPEEIVRQLKSSYHKAVLKYGAYGKDAK